MKRSWLIGIYIISIIGVPALASEQYSFRVYRTPPSVTDDRIMAMHETPEGALWVAIWGKGVCRIKGTDSRSFTTGDGLPSEWVRCLAPDEEDGVWVGSADGISHITGDEVRTFTTDTTPSILQNSVRCIEVLRSGQMCFGMAAGGVLCRGGNPFAASPTAPSEDEWTYVGYPEIPAREGIDDLIEASDGSIWLALHNGEVLQFAGGEWLRHDSARGLTVNVSRLYEDRAGTIWGAGGDRLAEFADNRWRILEGAVDSPRVVAESPGGELFVGTDEGIRVLNASGWRSLPMGLDIGDPSVSALLFGQTGTPWVGTGEGLIRGSRPVWTGLSTSADGTSIRSTPLYADLHTPPISADSKGNLIRYEAGQWQPISHVNNPQFRPKWFSALRDGKVWALCEDDALFIDVASGEVIHSAPLPVGAQTIRLEWGPEGSPWLLGSLGVRILEGSDWRPFERHAETRKSWAFDMDVAENGTTYICYESGINVWKDGTLGTLAPFEGLPRGAHYTSVRCMRDGTVWFGTYGEGIVVYEGNDFRHITRDDGPMSDHVSQIFEASDGTVWVAYRRKGVSSYKDGRWVNFGHRHGLPNAVGATFAEHPAGTIWLASDAKGIFRYVPDGQGPETTITAATDKIAARGTGVFSFSGIDAWHRTLARDMAYSWRIVPENGPKPAWEPIQTASTAVISGLPAGRYLFEVRATDEDRNADASPSAIAVTIEPAFYTRPGFVAPVGLLTGLVALSLLSLYVKQLRLKDSESSLRRSETGLAEAQRIAHVGNWEWNVTNNTMTCSPQVYRILGWPSVDHAPTVAAIRQTIHADDKGGLDEAMQRSVKTGEPLDFDHRIIRANGEVRFIHQRGEVIVDQQTGKTRMRGTLQDITERKKDQADRERLIGELQDALAHIKTLRGLIPICSSCKRIRDDSGYWNQLETFIKARSDAEFSHAICPDCAKEIYGVDNLMDNPESGKPES